jgi:hypothetical protein
MRTIEKIATENTCVAVRISSFRGKVLCPLHAVATYVHVKDTVAPVGLKMPDNSNNLHLGCILTLLIVSHLL